MRRALVLTVALLAVCADGAGAISALPDDDAWVTNGSVNAIDTVGSTTYIGGRFSEVGLDTGPFVQVGAADGGLLPGWPEVESGSVDAIAPDGNGGVFVGGTFTRIGNIARTNLAHVSADGTVDTAFAPDPDGRVTALAVSGSTLYVGGSFFNIGGQARRGLAAVSVTTGTVDAWNAGSNSTVSKLVVDGAAVYVSGSFTTIGGASRAGLAAVDTTTATATPFNPDPNGFVSDILVTGSTLYAAGRFRRIGGLDRSCVAAVSTSTGQGLPGFGDVRCNTVATTGASALALAGATLYLGGPFTRLGSVEQPYLAALEAATGALQDWDARASGQINALAVAGDVVYFSGYFDHVGVAARRGAAAVTTATGALTAWDPHPAGFNYDGRDDLYAGPTVIVRGGEGVYLGGPFRMMNAVTRAGLAALDADGHATAWDPAPRRDPLADGSAGTIDVIEATASTVYVGGNFIGVGGESRNHLAAIDAQSARAGGFDPDPGSGRVFALALSGSTLYVGGDFTHLGGAQRTALAAVNVLTGVPADWNPAPGRLFPSSPVAAYSIATDGGTVFVSGTFNRIGGRDRIAVAALDGATGLALTTWNAGAERFVGDLAVADGLLYVVSGAQTIGGSAHSALAALNLQTGQATAWNPGLGGIPNALVPAGGSVLVGGAGYLGELTKADAGEPTAWSPALVTPAYSSAVKAIAVSAGRVHVGGDFTSVGDRPRRSYAQFAEPPGTGPDTTIGGAPGTLINITTPSFSFGSAPGATFECRLDVGDYFTCASPYVTDPLDAGDHLFDVRAVVDGVPDATAASYRFTIDLTVPVATIVTGPAVPIADPRPYFTFSANELSTFECRMDAGGYEPCSIPWRTAQLPDGPHTFAVRAIDGAGNAGEPAQRSFSVDTTPPDTTIISGPEPLINTQDSRFTFSSTDPGAHFECRLYNEWLPCASGVVRVNVGPRVLYVRAVDALGNADRTPAVWQFTVDTQPPYMKIVDGPGSGETTAVMPTYAFQSIDPDAKFECRIDDAPFAPCTSPYTVPELPPGEYGFAVRAVDAAKNYTDPSVRVFFRTPRELGTPDARFEIEPVRTCTGVVVIANARDSTTPNGAIAYYDWRVLGVKGFINGSFESSPNPLYLYVPGWEGQDPLKGGFFVSDQEVELTVVDVTGQRGTMRKKLQMVQRNSKDSRAGCPESEVNPDLLTYPPKPDKKAIARGDNLTVTQTCPNKTMSCVGEVRIHSSSSGRASGARSAARRNLVIAKATYVIPAGKRSRVRARLTAAGKRLLRARRTLHARITVVSTEATGRIELRERKLTITRR